MMAASLGPGLAQRVALTAGCDAVSGGTADSVCLWTSHLTSLGCKIRLRFARGGEKGQGGMFGESNMETYITICKTDSQWEFAV